MTRFIPLLIILLTSSVSVLSQNTILDKPYIRDSNIRYCRPYIPYNYRNSIFSLEIRKTPINETDSILDLNYNLYSNSPLKISDCVYFTPNQKFINKYNQRETNNFFEGKREFFFYLNTNYYIGHEYKEPNLILPYSTRFYADTSNISIIPKQTEMVLDSNSNIPLDNYLKPFYFRKYEVTNLEYREFVNWVRDSIVRQLLLDGGMNEFGLSDIEKGDEEEIDPPTINWKTPIPWNSPRVKELLEPIYNSNNERFYRQKGIDSKKLNYVYYILNLTRLPGSNNSFIIRKEINVYPDTLCWVHDFNYSYSEPMTQNYFWHPAYNDYPVVGINYYQAIAFLNWKTKQHQAELDKKGIKLEIEYDLPTEAEWDIAATAEIENKKINIYNKNYYTLADNNWITDLSLTQGNILMLTVLKVTIITHQGEVIFYSMYLKVTTGLKIILVLMVLSILIKAILI